ncbi:MAG: GAF domain-containing protein [archaeon]|nr:GAF domain-containing protein [archaeon]
MSSSEINQLILKDYARKLICRELRTMKDLQYSLNIILKHIKNLTNIEAISIRLHKSGDYPYYSYDGFKEEFILQESSLCSKDVKGNFLFEPNGNEILLECMCGNIIRGRTNPDQDFFSECGSFWSNNTTRLLATTTDEDRQANTRNYCNSCGYESVALIPIRANGYILGLIQLNDHRIGMFTEDLIEFLEMIGELMGMKVFYSPMFTPPIQCQTTPKYFTICCHCRNLKDPTGVWKDFETYFLNWENSRFSHGICPNCYEKNYAELIKKGSDEVHQ